MKKYDNNEVVDVVVVGTGAGGAPVISRLARAGLEVVALEAGKHWDPKNEFATDEREQAKIIWNYERLCAGENPIPMGRNNSGIGVGGSTLAYTAYTPRPQPDDFKIQTEFGVGRDWPIGYEDLEPYFDELETFLGVSGPSPYPWGPPRKVKYSLPPLPLNGAAQLMQRGCKELNITTSPAANAILSMPYFQEHVGWRNTCTNRGFCQAGCSTGAKAGTDVTFIPVAIHFGAEIRTECFAVRPETDAKGKITSVIYLKNGVEEKQLCRFLFLCCGAIETPRLLLMNNLANSSGQVGKNFMANVGTQVWGEFDEMIYPYKGIPASLISEDMHRPENVDFAGGYLLQSIGVMPITYASQLVRATGAWGKELRDRMNAYNHVAGIDMHGECLAHESNFLELSDEPDELGLPKPRIFFTSEENEIRMAKHGLEVMKKIWEKAGAKNMFVLERNAHTIGTCRMGNDSSSGVVDAEGRSFDIPNLFICDNSIFPSSLSVNPSLTIMALALRIADLFIKNYLHGNKN